MNEQRADVICGTCGSRCMAENCDRYAPPPDPASVLAALLAESPEATVAAIEALRGELSQRADHEAIQREAHFAQVISAIVRAYDHPADGTAYARMREAIDDARRLLHEPFPYYVSDSRSLLSKAPKEDR